MQCDERKSKLVRIGMLDAKLSTPLFFEIDLYNIIPKIRKARIMYLQYFMANGPFLRQPRINLVFETPENGYKYVRSWIKNDNNLTRLLELNKEVLDNPIRLIQQILYTWNLCEELWVEYIQEMEIFWDDCLAQIEMTTKKVYQFHKN